MCGCIKFLHIHICNIYVYVYVYLYMYTHIHRDIKWFQIFYFECTSLYICAYIYIHTHVYTCVYTYVYVYICVYIHVYTYMYIPIHTYIHTYIYTRKCINMYKYIYICMHTRTYKPIFSDSVRRRRRAVAGFRNRAGKSTKPGCREAEPGFWRERCYIYDSGRKGAFQETTRYTKNRILKYYFLSSVLRIFVCVRFMDHKDRIVIVRFGV